MKKEFSKKWKSSKQPRKQRKYLYNLPLHLRQKLLSANLEKSLRKKYGVRNIELVKGDEVKVMRGNFKGKTGKVDKIERKNNRVSIEGITKTKKDGTKVQVWFHSSKLKIIKLKEEDRRRFKNLEKKKQTAEKKENAQK
ncbi:MAG: 50S ribosomal protein L24 [Candidatus Pacearchaeota archaeon]